MSAPLKSFTLQLLQQYHATVTVLKKYILDNVDNCVDTQNSGPDLIQPGDSASYISLLTTSFVGSPEVCNKQRGLKISRPLVGMREVRFFHMGS